jgi:hypothetical protein
MPKGRLLALDFAQKGVQPEYPRLLTIKASRMKFNGDRELAALAALSRA